ncbi:MAG: alpha/beta hydrolase [Candidatus Andersenbacteria bacterium]|nr:alpha/beta hydrolase [Candidatus Andersenbacteria bacterium]
MQEKIKIGNLDAILHNPKASGSPGIVMVHGFGGEGLEEEFEDIANNLCRNGYTVLRFLFEGYGKNNLMDLTISKEMSELKSAIDFLESKNINKEKIGIISQSLGCVVSMLLNDPRTKAMAMLAPLINIRKSFEKEFEENQIKEFKTFGYTIIIRKRKNQKRKLGVGFWNEIKKIDKITKRHIKAINCPLLIIHGTGDQSVNYRESETIFEWANEPKQLKLIKGGRHVTIRDPKIRKDVNKYILDFFLKYIEK